MNIGFIKGIRQTIAKRAANKSAYKEYRTIIKDWEKRLNQVSCLKIEIAKTPRSIVSKNGFAKETLETLQTSEFLEKFHRFLNSKGYRLPNDLYFSEGFISRNSGVLGAHFNKSIIYNPRGINLLDLRIPIHETGHWLTKGINVPFLSNLKFGKDNHLYSFGSLLKKIPWVKNFFKETQICHLTKKEQQILRKDFKRAWNEGFFKHNPLPARLKEEVSACETAAKAKECKKDLIKLFRDYRKNPVEYLMPNAQLNRFEFVADYFNLAAQGFKFSPEITARYIKSGGPKIETIITKDDMAYLEKLRRQIAKKSLSDYGYTMSV